MTRWYAVQTHPRQEWFVHRELTRRGYDPYLPHYAGTLRHARKVVPVLKPLFTGYAFVGVQPDQGLYDAANTPGVARIVGNGMGPQELPENAIVSLKAKGDAQGCIDLNPAQIERIRFIEGEEVSVIAGPFAGFRAIVALDDGRLVRIWLNMFQGRVEATLDPSSIIQASSPAVRRYEKPRSAAV